MLNKGICVWLSFVLCFFILVLPSPSHARLELTYLKGKLQSPDARDNASTTQWEYLQELLQPFAFSLSYLNEGHLDDPEKHHRDGFIFQMWARRPVLVPWFSLAAGAGPYLWYDTQPGESGIDDYVRGLGFAGSFAAKIKLPLDGLYVQGRFNWIETRNNIDTRSFLFGIGTDFSSEEVLEKYLPEIHQETRNEILFHFYNFKRNKVKGFEYRRNLGILDDHIEVSASYFYKDESLFENKDSYGVATQIWAVNTLNDRFKFGFGYGIFLDLLDSPSDTSGMISYLLAFRISNHWNLQYSHSRILPNHKYEEDIRTTAVGYLF